MASAPSDDDLRAFVTAAVRSCADLMALSARQIRHDAQVRWGADLRARSAQISQWAVQAAERRRDADAGDAAALDSPASDPSSSTEAPAIASAVRPELASGAVALCAFVGALPSVLLGLEEGECELAEEGLRHAARLCRDARNVARAQAEPGGSPTSTDDAPPRSPSRSLERTKGPLPDRALLDRAYAKLEKRADEIVLALRSALASRSHALVRPGRQLRVSGEPKFKRARAACGRTRAVGVLTRQILRQLDSEGGLGARGAAGSDAEAPRGSEARVDAVYSRMSRSYGALLVRLFGDAAEGGRAEERVRALIGEEVEAQDRAGSGQRAGFAELPAHRCSTHDRPGGSR